MEESEPTIKDFMIEFGLHNIVKDKTCYKSTQHPKCIDLLLTNKNRLFQNTTTIDTGISDFHKMVLSTFRCRHDPGKPKEVIYRDYKNFDKAKFRDDLKTGAIHDPCTNWDTFENNFLKVLDKHAPLKKKTIRANHAPYMTKLLRKAIMKRTQLANKYHKTRTETDLKNFKKQKNFVNRLYKREKNIFLTIYQSIIFKTIRNSGKLSNHFCLINLKVITG